MIRLFGMITMLIDHAGLLLFPSADILRAIGRLSMPMFAYGIAMGMRWTMSRGTLRPYILRLSLCAFCTQPVYIMVMSMTSAHIGLNICFTWLAACFIIWAYDGNKKPANPFIMAWFWVCTLLITLLADYGWYGVLYPMVFYLAEEKKSPMAWAMMSTSVLTVTYIFSGGAPMQILSAFAIPIIYSLRDIDRLRIPRPVGYIFYPVHLLVLLCVFMAVH